MRISEAQKEEIKARIDIAELISEYGYQLKQNGSGLWCCCPFHNEKTPSFKVDTYKGMYHCFGCGESGDVYAFVMKQEGVSFGEAIRKLADKAGIELKEEINPAQLKRNRLYALMADLAVDFSRMLKVKNSKASEPARIYLQKRQISDETVDRFLIGYAPADVNKILRWATKHGYTEDELADAGIIKKSEKEGGTPYFYFANRLVFSIKDKLGRVVAFSGRQIVEDKKSGKYINSPETSIFKKSRSFFAFDEARKNIVKEENREAIICEGQIDCIRLHENGFKTAIAPLGTAFTEDHAHLLHRVADCALLCYDDDDAGHKATIRTATVLLAEGMPIRIVSLPDGDDPDSYILKHGKEDFYKQIVSNAESIVAFQIRAESKNEVGVDESSAKIRIAKAVLGTISKCKDAVYREVLLKEASERLDLNEEVIRGEIMATETSRVQEEHQEANKIIMPNRNKKSSQGVPNLLELAFMAFLMANEHDDEVRAIVESLVPRCLLREGLCLDFLNVWKQVSYIDEIQKFVEHLPDDDYRKWISMTIIEDSMQLNSLSPKWAALYFIRQLWYERLVDMLKTEKDSSKMQLIGATIKALHSATMKGLVHNGKVQDNEIKETKSA